MRLEDLNKRWAEFFDRIAVTYCGAQFVETKILVEALEQELQDVDSNVRSKLYYLFDYEGEAIVSNKTFLNLMNIWSAFSANDINNDNELDKNEVKSLFWLFDM